MEETNGSEIPPRPVKLESDVVNSIRHSFVTLDESGCGEIAKSQLQVFCASVCRDFGISFDAQDLLDYKPDSSNMSFRDFVEYLQTCLLPKGQTEAIDYNKIHELCWKIVEGKFLRSPDHVLSERSAFKQFLVFNVLDIEETSKVEKEEIGVILEKFMHAMGRVWDPKPLQEFGEEEVMTFWQYLDCLEKSYIPGNDKNVVDEALEEVVDHIVHEVIKQGYLVKKGHKMRSMKERWCVLKPGYLTYYTNSNCLEKKGVIVINKSSSVESMAVKGKYRFCIKCGESDTPYEMEAKDQKSRQEWIAGIQAAIDTSDGPTPQKKERLQRRLDRNERRQEKLEDERRKREQDDLMLQQQQELARLQELYQQAEGKAAEEAALLQEEIKKREELERLQKELQLLLETERRAKEEEEKVRALQEKLLEDERKRLEEMERLRLEKEQLLQDEMRMREDLEERHKEQEKILEEERKRLEQLDKERAAAEEAMKAAQQKLAAAEEASKRAAEEAKKKAREIKTAVGLARIIGPHVPSWTTHRGLGAFCAGDFSRIQAKAVMNDNSEKGANILPSETTESLPTLGKTGKTLNEEKADGEQGQDSENTEKENLNKGTHGETVPQVEGSEKGSLEKENNVSDKENQIGETTANLPSYGEVEKVIHEEKDTDDQVHCETEASEMAEHGSTETVTGEKPDVPTKAEEE